MTTKYPARFTMFRPAAVGLLALSASSVQSQPTTEDLKITPADGRPAQEFGCATAIDAGVLVVGARADGDAGANSGAAYLFDASSGSQIMKLTANDGAAGDRFGFSVAISGGIVAIGSPGNDQGGDDSGAAYLFDASTGAQLAKLTPDDAEAGDEFGNSIAIDNGTVAVGAWRADEHGDGSGAAYLFDASSGDQLDKLLPDTGSNFQTFGASIAIDGGTVAVGARTYFALGEGFTFAKVHLFDVSTGNQTHRLQAHVENVNGDQGGHFGDAIDIDNGLVAVGAWSRSIFFDHSGAAYIFDASTGEELHYIVPSDGHDRDNFGISVSIDDGVLAVGAHQDGDSGWVAGSAYLFDAEDGTQIDKLFASDGAASDYFGTSVCIDAGVVAVGAVGDEDNGGDSGSVYVFGGLNGTCPADLTGDGILDLADVQAFISAFTAQAPAADLAAPFGVLDLADVQAFISGFTAGCP